MINHVIDDELIPTGTTTEIASSTSCAIRQTVHQTLVTTCTNSQTSTTTVTNTVTNTVSITAYSTTLQISATIL